jgi:tetratricopeptide (TPR) repeat protein
LLDTLRCYALEQLEERQERETVAIRHAGYFATLCEQADAEWETTSTLRWLGDYQPELYNVKAAMQWALAKPERADIAIGLAGIAAKLWDAMGHQSEARPLIEQALALVNGQSRSDIAARLLHYGGKLWSYADPLLMRGYYEHAADLYDRIGDRLASAVVRMSLESRSGLTRYEEAKSALTEAETLPSLAERCVSLCTLLNGLGGLASQRGEYDQARQYNAWAGKLMQELDDPVRSGVILLNLAEFEFAQGDIGRAIRTCTQSIEGDRATGRQLRRLAFGMALNNLTAYLLHAGRVAEARVFARQALEIYCAEGQGILKDCLQRWALLAALDGNYRHAARVLGFAEAVDGAGYRPGATEQYVRDAITALLWANLPLAETQALAGEGALWSEAEAVAFTLRYLVPPDDGTRGVAAHASS